VTEGRGAGGSRDKLFVFSQSPIINYLFLITVLRNTLSDKMYMLKTRLPIKSRSWQLVKDLNL
jgi:hypothetical protein